MKRLSLLLIIASSAHLRAQDIQMEDTLRTVQVTQDGRLPIKVSRDETIKVRTLSDIIGQSTVDKILHPFAFTDRKRERHRRKLMKVLADYDKVKTNNELLIEALRREGIDPETLKPKDK